LQPDNTSRATQLIAGRHDLLRIIQYKTRPDSSARNVLKWDDRALQSRCMLPYCHATI